MSTDSKEPDLNVLIIQAERAIHSRKRPNHIYTPTRELDSEIYQWFRGRWPNVNVQTGTDAERSALRDREWWQTFIQHFEGRVTGLKEECLLQIDTKRLLLMNNVEPVIRAVWLCVEITRCREASG